MLHEVVSASFCLHPGLGGRAGRSLGEQTPGLLVVDAHFLPTNHLYVKVLGCGLFGFLSANTN